MFHAGSKCVLFLLFPLCAGLTAAEAGEVHLSWNLTPGASGYRVHQGSSSGNYPQVTDVGLVAETDVVGAPDCTLSYFAVTAYNGGGESGYSPELSSWPRPTFSGMTLPLLEQGTQRTLALTGNNFRAGDAVVFSSPGIRVDGVQVTSCGEMTVTVTVTPAAALGSTTLSVVHPSGVTGSLGSPILVTAAIAPTVVDVLPSDGGEELPVETQPVIEFSESVLGITAFNLQLVDPQGTPVAQSPGSPQPSADGTVATIVPAAALASGTSYRVKILGGAAGIVDQDGHPLEGGYLQGQGFTTIGDDLPPTATEPTMSDIGGTTVVIEWTTDESASGEVFYRKAGGTLYQTASGAGGVLDHTVTLTGLEPETEYEFHVGSTDGSGNSTTSSPDLTFTTGVSPYAYIRFESETGLLSLPIGSSTDVSGFGGAGIGTTAGAGEGTPAVPLGQARYSVHLPHSGQWTLWVRLFATDGSSDSWFEAIDAGAFAPVASTEHGQWSWVAGRSYTLASGLHEVRLGGHESGVRADRLLLTDDPDFLPTEAPDLDVTPPTPVEQLGAVFGNGQVQLEWTNPADDDLSRIVLRYRTDGQYPQSPVDGLPLIDEPALPGVAGAHTQTGVIDGLTYNYGLFAIDDFGNVSVVTHGSALALAPPPPPVNVSVE